MPKYRVFGRVIGTTLLGEYEADNPDAAIEKALDEHGTISLCHQCADQIDDPEIDPDGCSADEIDENGESKA